MKDYKAAKACVEREAGRGERGSAFYQAHWLDLKLVLARLALADDIIQCLAHNSLSRVQREALDAWRDGKVDDAYTLPGPNETRESPVVKTNSPVVEWPNERFLELAERRASYDGYDVAAMAAEILRFRGAQPLAIHLSLPLSPAMVAVLDTLATHARDDEIPFFEDEIEDAESNGDKNKAAEMKALMNAYDDFWDVVTRAIHPETREEMDKQCTQLVQDLRNMAKERAKKG